MKVSHIFWGTLFIALGLLILINNFSEIYLAWDNIWQFWPVVLVLLGISVLIKHKVGKSLIAALAALILAVTIFATFKTSLIFWNKDIEVTFDDNDNNQYETKEYSEAFDSSITRGVLNLHGGAATIKVQSPTDDLILVKSIGFNDNLEFSKTLIDSTGEINLYLKKTKFHLGNLKHKNKFNILLNESPAWDLNFELGAALIDLDLTRFKVNKIDVDMGAASLNIKLGSLSNETNISVDAGASKIKITIPEEVAAELKIDDVLSTKEITGFQKIRSGLYRTTGFDNAKKKAYININCGVSSIKIIKYE
ncbi:hypothetical protein BMS3Abin03_02940 [bacterium BMS3Abin03]|nr:hypothetical protein BMS3Abin03_02940 [bacterium BMS3Abin03]